MAKIRILPEQLANQIAAGEVVERPASVVKELLENSLDAGATRVEIEIEGGGTRLIRIIDNGCGMDGDDLLLSLERHGTSKLIQAEDLGAIGTLGFRGEAIPSIGSVSHLSITSRPANQPLGTRVSLHYGKLVESQEMGCSYGTTSEVRHLFGNTPARRKFLRSTRTELGHIEEVVRNYCLCTPDVTFILRVDNRVIISFDHLQSIEQRLTVITNHSGSFLRISGKNKELPDHFADGFLLPPATITSGAAKLRLFVNGRTVRDRLMVHAVTEGMRNFLLKGHQPSGLLHLRLPPSMVDVNVHPAKHEVRFRNGKEVHEFIVQVVAKALIDHQQQLKLAMFSRDRGVDPSVIPLNSYTHGEQLSFLSTDLARVLDMPQVGEQEKRNDAIPEKISVRRQEYPGLLQTAEPIENASTKTSVGDGFHRQSVAPSADTLKKKHNLKVIGQFDNLYIFCQTPDGLVIIDQHAAHERLLFEKLRRQFAGASIARQTLLFPISLELSLFQIQLVEKYNDEILKLGFSLRDFGGNTFILSAVPALTGSSEPTALFLEILKQFGSETGQNASAGGFDHILATMACKAAVKAGTELLAQEIDALLEEMIKADLFSHCPHGRPVFVQFTREAMKKWFFRT